MMKSKLTQLLFMTAFVELVAPSCRRRRQGAKAHGRNPALICSLNGWPTAVHLKGPATMAVVGGKLRVCRLMAPSGHGDFVTACLLSGAKRKTSARSEHFAF